MVENFQLKKAIETLYLKYLPKGTHPFIYLDLHIKPENLDVNVHPTKKEVHYLHQDEIIQVICQSIDDRLANANESRVFLVQSTLTNLVSPNLSLHVSNSSSSYSQRTPVNQLVRTDSRVRTLDSYITPMDVPKNQVFHDLKSKKTIFDMGQSDIDVHLSDTEVVDHKQKESHYLNHHSQSKTDIYSEHSQINTDIREKEIIMNLSQIQEETVIKDISVTDQSKPFIEESTPLMSNTFNMIDGSSSSNSFSTTKPELFDHEVHQVTKKLKRDIEKEFLTTQISNSYTNHSQTRHEYVKVMLTSVLELRQVIEDNQHKELTNLFKDHTFVGCIDECRALIQHQTKLFMINYQLIRYKL